MSSSSLPPGASSGLEFYWDRALSETASVPSSISDPGQVERHRIYSLLTMALISAYWNGNKYGAEGEYPWRAEQRRSEGLYRGDAAGDRYLGHNIACVAVDENGEVVDFEFNHNELYNSSAEHAEARLVRRIFSLNQSYNHWQIAAKGDSIDVNYSNVLNGITLYTSLESCAQCSGIMALGYVMKVVYLQQDIGQNLIGNILYNLTRPHEKVESFKFDDNTYTRPKPKPRNFAPEPIAAQAFEFEYQDRLERSYTAFLAEGAKEDGRRFFKNNGKEKRADSLTSFLCTDEAKAIFDSGAQEFANMKLANEQWTPTRGDGLPATMTNAKALEHAQAFLSHAISTARRGTPHR